MGVLAGHLNGAISASLIATFSFVNLTLFLRIALLIMPMPSLVTYIWWLVDNTSKSRASYLISQHISYLALVATGVLSIATLAVLTFYYEHDAQASELAWISAGVGCFSVLYLIFIWMFESHVS